MLPQPQPDDNATTNATIYHAGLSSAIGAKGDYTALKLLLYLRGMAF